MFKRKKIILVVFIILILCAGLFYYFSFKNSHSKAVNTGTLINIAPNNKDIYTIQKSKDSYYINKENVTIVKKNIAILKVLPFNSNKIAYVTETETQNVAVYIYDLNSKKEILIAELNQPYSVIIFKNKLYLSDSASQFYLIYDEKGNLVNKKTDYPICGFDVVKGKLYAKSIFKTEKSDKFGIFLVKDDGTLSYLFDTKDIISLINVDEDGFYFTYFNSSLKSSIKRVDPKSGYELLYNDLEGNIIFMKNKSILLDTNTMKAYTLNTDLFKVKEVFSFNKDNYKFIQYDIESDKIYYVSGSSITEYN